MTEYIIMHPNISTYFFRVEAVEINELNETRQQAIMGKDDKLIGLVPKDWIWLEASALKV